MASELERNLAELEGVRESDVAEVLHRRERGKGLRAQEFRPRHR
jgi:hypothetical protein